MRKRRMAPRRYEIQLYGNGDLPKCLTKLKSTGTKITSLTVNDKGAHFRTDKKGLKQIRKYRRRYGLKVMIESTGKDPGLKTLFNAYRYLIAFMIPFAGSFFLWTVD